MEYKNTILAKLKNLADEKYKIFNSKIIKTNQIMLGVRMPILRQIAKTIVNENAIQFIKLDKDNIYEMILLEGIVLSYMKIQFIQIVPLMEKYLVKVDNWAQIDSPILSFKGINNEKENVLEVVKNWLKSKEEFVVRAGLVILLVYYINKENLKMIFDLSESIKHTGYYVYMANAWLISVCMVKFPKETIDFFKTNKLDIITHNKAIQKSKESYRVSKDNKLLINQLKR
jgi:3-methyladenine DNA glycosylase AlkD